MAERLDLPRRVYRVVRADPPTRTDFLSPAVLGRRFADPRQHDLAEGISVFATEAQARRQALAYQLGRHIAELQLPAGAEIRRTQRRTAGHHTVRADAEALLRSVVRVVPVD